MVARRILCHLYMALLQASTSLVDMSKKEVSTLSRFASNEHEQRMRLQEQIETLAKQHSSLERAAFCSHASSIEQPRKSSVSARACCLDRYCIAMYRLRRERRRDIPRRKRRPTKRGHRRVQPYHQR